MCSAYTTHQTHTQQAHFLSSYTLHLLIPFLTITHTFLLGTQFFSSISSLSMLQLLMSPYFFSLLLHHPQSEKSHMTFEGYKPRHGAETLMRRGLGGAGQKAVQDKAKGQGLMKYQTVAGKYVQQQEILFIDNVSFTLCHYLYLPGSWKRLTCVFVKCSLIKVLCHGSADAGRG